MNIGIEKYAFAAAGGMFAVFGMSFLQRKSTRDVYMNSHPVKKSMAILEGYPNIHSIFGAPVKLYMVDLQHVFFNHTDDKLTIPIRFHGGVKKYKHGILYSYCTKMEEETEAGDNTKEDELWQIDRLDIEVVENRRRWTFYVDPNVDSKKCRVQKQTETKENSDS